MITLNGIGTIESAGYPRDSRGRDRQVGVKTEARQDGLAISAEAQRASEAKQFILQAESSQEVQDIRHELVDAAKERLREGSHRLTEMVLQVAARVAVQLDA
jgi:hypothetical protein